jgi:NAD(P)-dependent dehydrogenase (short-subunit alcohol dehydrogenase family)
MPDESDRQTILITGATDGVGRVVAERLARAGARVLLHGRNREKGENVLRAIRASTSNEKLEYLNADLASLDEVRALAQQVTERTRTLTVLINNAGIGPGPAGARDVRALSREGHELRFAVNYLSHFLLTRLLLARLRQSVPARIVNVSSGGQRAIDFEDVMLELSYDGWSAYMQSKLAQIMFTFDLDDELEGTGITANALHPSTYMNTKMVAEIGIRPTSRVEEGADAIVHVATSPRLDGVSGVFFDRKRPARAHAQAYDATARQKLRELSRRLTGLDR